MNIDILVQNASSIRGDVGSHGVSASSNATTTNGCRHDCPTLHLPCGRATTTDYNDTVATTTSADVGGMSPIVVHFLAVGALFVAVLVLAAVNAYLHFRSTRRRRLFQAPPPPAERMYSQRRRSRRGGSAASTLDDDWAAQSDRRLRMTMRMKPTKMFTM